MPHSNAADPGAPEKTPLRWWTELPLLVLVYAAYTAGRLLVRGNEEAAVDHGLAILRVEQALRINAEHPLNRLFRAETWIGVPADFWYASLHYVLTPVVLVWIFRRRKDLYRRARTWLMTSTMVGLIGFTLLPTCPPRLLDAKYGFLDTMAQYSDYGWWGGEASAPRGMGGMTNQFAAMPSLHVGWALWCGVLLWYCGRGPLMKTAAVVYPLGTTIVVMGTANHYFLDAVAGAATMGVGLLLTRPVLRLAQRVRELLGGRPVKTAARPSRSVIVGAECQTPVGERIPGQRQEAQQPGARPADSTEESGRVGAREPDRAGTGEGAPAAAR
ncbi:phosphatase PAP2 family protein [Streptomyces physcomitrii]|uniref:Phosphatase PAP2 family protein n=1 Tax=Streptomyces physcomitrii TaxID=2724184 RepID=A0ABX1GXY2_9ACTN|nr:phosphatase PAP2 family protein [Streptomyces physcomitrii]NKI39844.1 phosphatase PAP2 family protein [Streptomyces physcomitrii]